MNVCAIWTISADHYFLPGAVAVREILKKKGWDVECEVEEVWTGFRRKLHWAHRCARELTRFTHLMLIDSGDVVVLGTPDEVMARYMEFDHPWVCSAEPFIWPADMYPPERYPACDTPYRHLNSGAYIAEREHLLACLDRWPAGGIELKDFMRGRGEDGPFLTEFYLNDPGSIVLDHECKIFQSMCGSQVGDDPYVIVTPGQAYNRVTDSYPLVIHFNGGGDITTKENRILWDY